VTGYKLGETAENFVRRADQALYRSKNTGRNKVSGL
jgi:PleD family two-component response regulator